MVTAKSNCPTPRMKAPSVELLPSAVTTKLRLGVTFSISRTLKSFACSMVAAVIAVTDIGVSCRLSSRLRAVTRISSSAAVPAGWAVASVSGNRKSRQKNTAEGTCR